MFEPFERPTDAEFTRLYALVILLFLVSIVMISVTRYHNLGSILLMVSGATAGYASLRAWKREN
jgi:hypothetical protein